MIAPTLRRPASRASAGSAGSLLVDSSADRSGSIDACRAMEGHPAWADPATGSTHRNPAFVDRFDGLRLGLGGRSRGIDDVIPTIDQVGIGLGMFRVTGGLSVLFLIHWSAYDYQRRQHLCATGSLLFRSCHLATSYIG